jgi:spermidine/putrescine ABC transporter ATP-binding subunit
MMGDPRVRIERISHRYGSVTAIDDVSLDIADGEFVTLLGPSGCGKTTLLRIIAGFERPAHGRVLLAGEDVTRRPAHRRATNMVFQRPTLFPHLDVFANVAFGLQIAGASRPEQRKRVQEALELVRLAGYERRRSHELSGGQMQRIALARALVNRPKVLLLDEPLSALDLKIRLEMEAELRRVHRETGATFVYVTHDQREAMALSDRIAVMNAGRIEQVGVPTEVYRRPASVFAAQFVGNANVLAVEVVEVSGEDPVIQLGDRRKRVRCPFGAPGSAYLVLRPEAITAERATGDRRAGVLHGVVRDVAFRGTGFSCRIELPELGVELKAEGPGAEAPFEVGDAVVVDWHADAGWLLPRSGDTAPIPVPDPEEARA